MKALVFSTNFRNADNWMSLFQRIIAAGGQCDLLAMPWTGDPSHIRLAGVVGALPITHSIPIGSLTPDGISRADLKSALKSACSGVDVIFVCDMQSYPSRSVLSILNELPSRPIVIGLQHGLFQSWWLYNDNFCADWLFVFGERHRRMLEPRLRNKTFAVGLPKLDRLYGITSEDRGYVGYLAQKIPSIEQIAPLLSEVESAESLPVLVREHPQYPLSQKLFGPGLTTNASDDVLDFISGAQWLITPHSTAGLEAVILGKPVVLVPNAGLTAWAGYPSVAWNATLDELLAARGRFATHQCDVDLFLDDVVGGTRFDHTDRAFSALMHVLSTSMGGLNEK